MSKVQRFWSKVDMSAGIFACWPWLSWISRDGYGAFWVDGKARRAHRIAYELATGRSPAQLDHLCRNRACVNPAHLEPVTTRQNVLRGVGPTALNARKERCSRGHPLSDARVIDHGTYTERRCRECVRQWSHEARLRRRVIAFEGVSL